MVDHADIDHTGLTGVGGTLPTLVAAKVNLTSGNLSTSSTTFVDATGLTATVTTGARRLLVGFVGAITGNTTNSFINLDVAVDGTRQGQATGLTRVRVTASGVYHNGSFTYLTDVLSAASHTVKLQWCVSAGTGNIIAVTTDSAAIWWVQEVL